MSKTNINSNFFSLKAVNKILALIIIVLGVYYVAGINDLSIRGFELSDLKRQRNKMADLNNRLELNAMNLSAYASISQRINNLKMVAVGEISYVYSGAEAVAKK
ncbi:MAG: hypothetical protein Q8O93_01670 [bacterium]|nr:hypothetical protein [bacterium]